MRSRLFRTMGASLSLAASIALSAGSTQALGGPGRGGSTTQSNLAQNQAHWLLGADPSDLSSGTQQDTTGQLDVHEQNENGPFTLGSRVESGDVAQANVALGSADDQTAVRQSDETGDATLEQTTDQSLVGQDPRRLRNENQPTVLWSSVESGDVAQANVERGSASNASTTRQAAEPSFGGLTDPVMASPEATSPLSGLVGSRSGSARTSADVAGATAGMAGSAALGGSSGSSSGTTGTADQARVISTPIGSFSIRPVSVASDVSSASADPNVQPMSVAPSVSSASAVPDAGSATDPTSSTADPASSTTDQSATGQVGVVQVNVNDPVTVLSRVQSGDVEQANVASGRGSNASLTRQSDPNDPTQSATGQGPGAQVNVNAPVTVLSRVQSGDVRQANIASGTASNHAATSQESNGGDLVSDAADLTSGSSSSTTGQSATGQSEVAQVNVNAPVTVLSRVQSGDVAQANVALGQASNQSRTAQEGSTPLAT